MKRSAIVYTTKQVIKMVDNGTYCLTSAIQRRGGVWVMGSLKSSLLIHSILAGYVIPPLYIVREDTGELNEKGRTAYKSIVIDGKQRITVVRSFVNNEWALDVETPNIVLDGQEIEIAGKKFEELPEEVQDEILSFNFNIYNLDECSDEEIEECFFRLNNGVVLTKGEQSKAKIGLATARFINDILKTRFFTEIAHFTSTQINRSADQLALMQSMMLLDMRNDDYNLYSISEGDVLDYATEMHGNYTEEKKERIRNIISYLEEAFSEKEKFIKKINLPMIMVMADKAIQEGIPTKYFVAWFREFVDAYNPQCEYASYCGSGSVKREKTLKRIEIMEDSFDKYMTDHHVVGGFGDLDEEETETEADEAEETADDEETAESQDNVAE